MKLTFLGSGGGRFATISQKRMTGGFRIDDFGGKNYQIDPGPGALVRSYQYGVFLFHILTQTIIMMLKFSLKL